MSLPSFQNWVDNTIQDATQMSDAQLVSSFAVHGCGDFSHFINFDRDSLIDLYVQHTVFDSFDTAYPFMRAQLSQGMAS